MAKIKKNKAEKADAVESVVSLQTTKVAANTPRRSTRVRVSTYKVKSAASEGENSDSGISKTDSENLAGNHAAFSSKPKSARKSKVLKAHNINASILQDERMDATNGNVEEKPEKIVLPETDNIEMEEKCTEPEAPLIKDNDEKEETLQKIEDQETPVEPEAVDKDTTVVMKSEDEPKTSTVDAENVLTTVIPTEKRKSEDIVKMNDRHSKKFKAEESDVTSDVDEQKEIQNQMSPLKVSSPKLAIIDQHQSPLPNESVKQLEIPIVEEYATEAAQASPMKDNKAEVLPGIEEQNDEVNVIVEEQHNSKAGKEEMPEIVEIEKSDDSEELSEVVGSNEVLNVEEQHEINEISETMEAANAEEINETIAVEVQEISEIFDSNGIPMEAEKTEVKDEITKDEKPEDELDHVMIDLVEEYNEKEVIESVAEVKIKKKVNTINLITPGPEKRGRQSPLTVDQPSSAPQKKTDNKKVIEILDSPDQNPKITVRKSASATKDRMTRATFLSGCNDSIYIHAENLLLKSCRKRSQSFSIDDHSKSIKKNNRVQFYSPLNMEIDIPTIDTRLQQNTTISECAESIAGKRRKRSMSEPNIDRTNEAASDGNTLKKVPSRIKIPNFTAIHEQNFKKMESIAEHVARKVERQKQILATSKSPMTSAKKQATSKVVVKIPTKCNIAAVPAKSAEPPKAVIAMPVMRNAQISTTALANRTKLNLTAGAAPAKAREPTTSKPAAQSTTVATVRTPKQNVAVAGPSKPAESKVAAPTTFAANRDKTAQRLQAYKQKTGGSTTDEANKSKRHAAIKGVRSNRRFDLQMQFREREAQGTGE